MPTVVCIGASLEGTVVWMEGPVVWLEGPVLRVEGPVVWMEGPVLRVEGPVVWAEVWMDTVVDGVAVCGLEVAGEDVGSSVVGVTGGLGVWVGVVGIPGGVVCGFGGVVTMGMSVVVVLTVTLDVGVGVSEEFSSTGVVVFPEMKINLLCSVGKLHLTLLNIIHFFFVPMYSRY